MASKDDTTTLCVRWDRDDLGCWGDGNTGWRHVRQVLAALLREVGGGTALQELLECGEEPYEEDLALERLQEYTAPDLIWAFVDGDLLLIEADQLFEA